MDLEVVLTADELSSTVEALHDTLLRRIGWCVHPDMVEFRKNLDFETAQIVVDQMAQAYTKAMMYLRDIDNGENISPHFYAAFTMSEDTWDTLAEITTSNQWAEVRLHARECACEACTMLGSRR